VLRLRGLNHVDWKPDRLRDISTKLIVTPLLTEDRDPSFISPVDTVHRIVDPVHTFSLEK
jgi:hypothetical protein